MLQHQVVACTTADLGIEVTEGERLLEYGQDLVAWTETNVYTQLIVNDNAKMSTDTSSNQQR